MRDLRTYLNRLQADFGIAEQWRIDFTEGTSAGDIAYGRLVSNASRQGVRLEPDEIDVFVHELEKTPRGGRELIDLLISAFKKQTDPVSIASVNKESIHDSWQHSCDLCEKGLLLLPTERGGNAVVLCDCLSGRARSEHLNKGTNGRPVASTSIRPELKDLAIRLKGDERERLREFTKSIGIDPSSPESTQLVAWQNWMKNLKSQKMFRGIGQDMPVIEQKPTRIQSSDAELMVSTTSAPKSLRIENTAVSQNRIQDDDSTARELYYDWDSRNEVPF